jgi:hypothetical protein
MNECKPSFKEFCVAEMRQHGDLIQKWAHSTNVLLKTLALEVIEAAEQVEK